MTNGTYNLCVIEDDLPIQHLYQTKLELEGFSVATASNGETGFELCERERPDLILLDLRMPVMSGDAMLAKLRAEDWGAQIRVIILTNISKDEAPSALRFLAVDRYIVKAHYTPTQVVDIVKEVLNIR